MTPRFLRDLRRISPTIVAILLFIVMAIIWVYVMKDVRYNQTEDPVTPEPEELIWGTIQYDSVLFWPVINKQCVRRDAMRQLHTGTKVLVVYRHENGMVEIALEDQSGEHTVGCVHESMLSE